MESITLQQLITCNYNIYGLYTYNYSYKRFLKTTVKAYQQQPK